MQHHNSLQQQSCASFICLTNRFHVDVHLFYRSQNDNVQKCVKEKHGAQEYDNVESIRLYNEQITKTCLVLLDCQRICSRLGVVQVRNATFRLRFPFFSFTLLVDISSQFLSRPRKNYGANIFKTASLCCEEFSSSSLVILKPPRIFLSRYLRVNS